MQLRLENRSLSLVRASAIFCALSLTACASMGAYNARTYAQIRHKRTYEPVNAKEFKVEDSNLIAEYTPDILDAGTSFQFTNKTNKVIKIIWDETAYLAPSGQSERIFHAGVKLIDRGQSQPPTVIPPRGHLLDDLIPIANVEPGSGQFAAWRYNTMCGTQSLPTRELQDAECIGKIFGYFLTYEIDGKKKNMTAQFRFVSKEPLPKESAK